MKNYNVFEKANLLNKLEKMLNLTNDNKDVLWKIAYAIKQNEAYSSQDLCELEDFLLKFFTEKLPNTLLDINNLDASERHCLKSLKEFIDVFEKEEKANDN